MNKRVHLSINEQLLDIVNDSDWRGDGRNQDRPPADDDYRLLYSDSDAYARVAQRVIERGAEQMVPWVMEKTGLSREDAFLLFVHNVQGNLAVNRLLGWRRGPEFAHAQELLNAYSEGGLLAVSALRDSDNPS